ncbi:MAG TPA: hypothetical protein VFK05_05685 [Polyangiaceae bacterium]|nr:hypothetical protein [Polyangiaceae bacterium]
MGNDVACFQVLLAISACCSLGGVACGSASSEYGDTPSASGGQLRWDFFTPGLAAEAWLVLVDDTKAGAGLRDALAKAFDDWDTEVAIHEESCTPPVDPAVWHPIDRSIVFVHPSTPGVAGYTSPAHDPALRFRAQQIFGPERARWMDAVRAGINAQPAPPGAAFRALAAVSDAESLLDHSRPPQSAAEQAVLDALPAPQFVEVLALATEDESPGEASQYRHNPLHEVMGAVLPAAEQQHMPSDCSERDVPTTPRYQAFSRSAQAWPCEKPDFFLTQLWSDCSTRCLNRPIAVKAGTAQCLAMASFRGTEPCPGELGWLDPLDRNGTRLPRVDGSGMDASRVCEIRQLEGPALHACVNRLDCADCEPGWCATKVPELVPQQRCAAGSFYPPFRFVLGAGQAHRAQVTIVCNEAPG